MPLLFLNKICFALSFALYILHAHVMFTRLYAFEYKFNNVKDTLILCFKN